MIRKLLHRGWSDHEILDYYERVQSPKKEHRLVVVFAFIVLGAVAITIPFAYGVFGSILPALLFYLVLSMVGVCFGAVLGLLFADLERLDRKHHIVVLFVLPLLIFSSTHWFLIQGFTYADNLFLHNTLISGLVYSSMFTLAYAVMVAKEWNSRIGQ